MVKIRIGIAGLLRGAVFLELYGKSFEETVVTAVCEVDGKTIEDRKKDGSLTEDIKVFSDYDEMLESGLIDAVVLLNFFHEHADYAIKAMKKGIAVLSDTTAAPSLGKCVDLVETAEATGAKYMLGANCLYFPGLHAMRAKVKSGELGELFTGYAEYLHGIEPVDEEIDMDNLHWRKLIPATYYNMHSLGPLMYVSNTMPVKVSVKTIHKPEYMRLRAKVTDCPAAMVITTMDNGAVFNTTGCSIQSPSTKFYRLGFSNGNLETIRYEREQHSLVEFNSKTETYITKRYTWTSSGVVSADKYEKGAADNAGHGGGDYFVAYHFIQYMLGNEEPFYNVYRSVALSAVGILGWYSALSDGKEYDIPDFSKKEERDKVRGDYRCPIAKSFRDITLPCRLADKDKFEG